MGIECENMWNVVRGKWKFSTIFLRLIRTRRECRSFFLFSLFFANYPSSKWQWLFPSLNSNLTIVLRWWKRYEKYETFITRVVNPIKMWFWLEVDRSSLLRAHYSTRIKLIIRKNWSAIDSWWFNYSQTRTAQIIKFSHEFHFELFMPIIFQLDRIPRYSHNFFILLVFFSYTQNSKLEAKKVEKIEIYWQIFPFFDNNNSINLNFKFQNFSLTSSIIQLFYAIFISKW